MMFYSIKIIIQFPQLVVDQKCWYFKNNIKALFQIPWISGDMNSRYDTFSIKSHQR